ncbi:helix-turn-helix transcriptional regulator [Streptomyces sp. NPDC023327]|uniref:helix-turn-helix transcriptional regulator n=1 Tax=Streptomyces sp. NPDC023327 TaxID=3157088 RepID=UPI0033D4A9F2
MGAVDPDRADGPAGFAACLDALRRQRGLSYERMAAAAGKLPPKPGGPAWEPLARSTIGEIVTGRRMPSRDKLLTFLAVCEVPATEVSGWLAAWSRVGSVSVRRPSGALLVRDARPRALGVHAAIQVTGPATAADELPVYVPRDVDARLRAALAAGRFVLLVGGSSVGKTRSAWEAVRAERADWWLVQPPDATALAALAAAPAPRTVVWLDEFQNYLSDGLTPATIRALLAGEAETVLVGTLWPDHYFRFTAKPGAGEDDLFRREREVLKQAEVIDLADRLTPAERELADAAARDDPRIRVALTSADYGMTQVLAAAPHLVLRWEQASDPYARALITAAVDARRLGVEGGVPTALLTAAVPAYLAPSEIARAPQDWFARATAYATRELHGATSVLNPLPGREMGTVAGYTVADYLLQHGAATRRASVPADSVWQAYADHLTGADLWRTGRAAEDRGLFRQAEQIYSAAAGDLAQARSSLIDLMARQGRIEDEERVRRAAAAAGDDLELVRLGNFLDQRGRPAEAERVFRDGLARGDMSVVSSLASFLDRHGRTAEALTTWRQAITAGHHEWFPFIEFLQSHRMRDQAYQALREGARAGDLGCRNQLVMMLDIGERAAEAEEVLWRSAMAGHRYAHSILARRLESEGRVAEAEWVWRHSVRHGDGDETSSSGREMLSDLLLRQGRPAEAEELWRAGVRAGEHGSASGLATVLERQGRVDEAVELLLPSALKGDPDALLTLSLLLGRHGKEAEEERLLEEVSTTYDKGTGWLVSLLLKQGRSEEAEAVLLRSALNGGESAWSSRSRLVQLLVESGRIDEAEGLLRRIAAAGNLTVNEELVTFLETHRNTDESEAIWRRLVDHGDSATRWYAGHHLTKLLARTGRIAEIEELWRRNLAMGGGTQVLDVLTGLLAEQGRTAEADRLRREGVS